MLQANSLEGGSRGSATGLVGASRGSVAHAPHGFPDCHDFDRGHTKKSGARGLTQSQPTEPRAGLPLLQLDFDHAHRRLARVRRFVRHVRLTEPGAAAVQFRCLGLAVRIAEHQRAAVDHYADVR